MNREDAEASVLAGIQMLRDYMPKEEIRQRLRKWLDNSGNGHVKDWRDLPSDHIAILGDAIAQTAEHLRLGEW
jgi:hypothetical protein